MYGIVRSTPLVARRSIRLASIVAVIGCMTVCSLPLLYYSLIVFVMPFAVACVYCAYIISIPLLCKRPWTHIMTWFVTWCILLYPLLAYALVGILLTPAMIEPTLKDQGIDVSLRFSAVVAVCTIGNYLASKGIVGTSVATVSCGTSALCSIALIYILKDAHRWTVPASTCAWCVAAVVTCILFTRRLAASAGTQKHTCAVCGYSLIGLETTLVCPECGSAQQDGCPP